MTNRRVSLLSFTAAALIALLLPAVASAQSNRGPWWGRDRDYRRDRDRDYRSGRNSDHDRRVLRDVARRIENRSHDFQRHLDAALDRSRYDDTRREDNINQMAREFRNAADRFEDRAGDSYDLSRSSSEARQLLSIGARIDRQVSRVRLDSRTASDWAQIRHDLRTVADIYGFRFGDFDGRGRGRDDDYYRRDRNGRNNNGGWRWPTNVPRPW